MDVVGQVTSDDARPRQVADITRLGVAARGRILRAAGCDSCLLVFREVLDGYDVALGIGVVAAGLVLEREAETAGQVPAFRWVPGCLPVAGVAGRRRKDVRISGQTVQHVGRSGRRDQPLRALTTIGGSLVIVRLLVPEVEPCRVVEGLTPWRSQSHFLAELLL